MVRKQIVIEPEQETALANLAAERGVSQSELVRGAIEQLLAEARQEADRLKAHEELMAFFAEERHLGLTDENGKRNWKREDLYDFRGFPRLERDRLRERSRRPNAE